MLTENVLKDKVEQDFCKLKGKITQVEEDLKYINDYREDTGNIHSKLVLLEYHSRTNNTWIDEVKEDSKKS